MLAGVPDLGAFPALPRPLRTVLGWHAGALDGELRGLAARRPGVVHAPAPALTSDLFATDGFHPNTDAYARWAQHLTGYLCTRAWWSDRPGLADLEAGPRPPGPSTGGFRETYGVGVPDGPGAGHGDQVGSIRKTIRLRCADLAHHGPFAVRLSDAAQPAPTAEGQDG